MNELPKYSIQVTALEVGILMGLIGAHPEQVPPLRNLWEELCKIQRQIREKDGVKIEVSPNGLLEMTDASGSRISRLPYPWENERGDPRPWQEVAQADMPPEKV